MQQSKPQKYLKLKNNCIENGSTKAQQKLTKKSNDRIRKKSSSLKEQQNKNKK